MTALPAPHIHWHTASPVFVGLLLVFLVYSFGIVRRHQRHVPGTSRPTTCVVRFGLGLLVFYLAIASPLDALGEHYLLSAHMLQHLCMIYPVPMLLLTSTPAWLLTPLLAQPGVVRGLRLLTHPVVAWALFQLVLAAWHIPLLYEWALRQRLVHNLEHLTLLSASVLMWWPVLSPAPQCPRLTPGAQVFYLLALSIGQLPVFAYITFSNTVLYPTYAVAPRILPLMPLEDQQLAGILMHVVGMGVLFDVLAVIFWQWSSADSPLCKRRGTDEGATTGGAHPHVHGVRCG
jgi:putative membrane protein